MQLVRLARAATLVAKSTTLALFARSPAGAVEAVPAGPAVAGPEFTGLPDKDPSSGVFLDIVAPGSSSFVAPSYFQIVVAPDATSLRVAVFDANVAGLWDQGGLQSAPDGTPSLLRTSAGRNAVVHYDLAADGDFADDPEFVPFSDPSLTLAVGDSEDLSTDPANPPAQRSGAVVFRNANDGVWEFLYDGAHHPGARLAATGEWRYILRVEYRTFVANSIAGFKVAANGLLAQRPFSTFEGTLLGGFIGGVVDNRALAFTYSDLNGDGTWNPGEPFAAPGTPGYDPEKTTNFSVSRDHYPDVLEPLTAGLNTFLAPGQPSPAVRFPPPDPYVNRYTGTFDVRVRLVPRPGESWEQMLESLILEEGDADNATATPNPGLPRDDGQPHDDSQGFRQNNSGYRLPLPPAMVPAGPPPTTVGRPWLEVIDPAGVVRGTLRDMSGNVSQEDGTSQAFVSLKPQLPPSGGMPGDWTLRMHDLDARNTWFLRTNARLVTGQQGVAGRVVCEEGCDGTMEASDEGIAGVEVTVRRTDGMPFEARVATTDAAGAWSMTGLPVGSFEAFVAPGQPELVDREPTTPQPVTFTLAAGQSLSGVDFGYCCEEDECPECPPGGKVHEVCFEATLWYDARAARRRTDVYVRLDADCCAGRTQDLVTLCYDGAFPGAQRGRNGVIRVEDVAVDGAEVKVRFCLEATAPIFPLGHFDGVHRIEVVVNGISEVVCTKITCDTVVVGSTVPIDWKPRWPCDRPVFVVTAVTPWDCWEKPCVEGCVRARAWWKVVSSRGACPATRTPWPCTGAEERTICAETWWRVMQDDATCDTWTWLAQEWIAAQLNVCAGACEPEQVAEARAEAETTLTANCGGFAGRWLVEERAALLAKVLELYNTGRLGPARCEGTPPTCPPPPPPPPCPPPPPAPCEPVSCPADCRHERPCEDAKECRARPKGCSHDRPCRDDRDCRARPKGCDHDRACRSEWDCRAEKDDDRGRGGEKDKDRGKGDRPDKPEKGEKGKRAEKGNNGVGNGTDPQPPGHPPVNDGRGTSPGSPGAKGGRK
jgi:hypothetical protein